MKPTNIPCPGSTIEKPHCLQASEDSKKLFCLFYQEDPTNHIATYVCPFQYLDEHKAPVWQEGYNSATGKFD